MSGGFAGTLGERVALRRRAATRDALGGWTGDWTVIGDPWVRIAPDGDGVAATGSANGGLGRWRVTMRARDLRVGDRIDWKGARLIVRALRSDAAAPDRIVAIGEMER